MASPEFRRALRLPLYSGTQGRGTRCARLQRANLLRRCPRDFALTLVLACALANGGCALSIPLDSVFGNKSNKDDVTASFAQEPHAASPVAALFEGDLVHARSAAIELLARGGTDASTPWENPDTGARGNVTPVASSYKQDGLTCRDFLASYIRGEAQAWLQGEACRMASGRWEVKSLKPLKRT